ALAVEPDRLHARLDRPHRHPRLRNGLARTGRADEQRVRPAPASAERDRDQGVAAVAPDDQLLLAAPTRRGAGSAAPQSKPVRDDACDLKWTESLRGAPRQVAPGIEVFAVPTAPQPGRDESAEADDRRRALQKRTCEQRED